VNRHEFSAMGTVVVVVGGLPAHHEAIETLFRGREWTFSRFIDDSELNHVNASAGRPVLVSPVFAETLRAALAAEAETDGMVVPTIGGALEAAGYTRDFSLLEPDPDPPGDPRPAVPGSVSLLGRLVRVAPGVQLDLNGVVKSRTVDEALTMLPAPGFVSAGGDLASHGEVSVGLPDGEVVALRRGALATSGTVKRHWLRAGRLQHHLIDARSGRPAMSRWTQVTACGATCLAADVAAKAGFFLDADGPGWLDEREIPARFVDGKGGVTVNRAWSDSMREAPACI
jgi:thiamine biosynthesis lipoprotein